MSTIELLTVEEVKELATILHGDQPRRGIKSAYWQHPLAVHEILIARFPSASTDTQSAALMHDVVEDKRATPYYLQSQGVSETALVYVEILTRRPGESSETHFERVSACGILEVLCIKWADCSHNAIWSEEDKQWNHRWQIEQQKYLQRAVILNQMILKETAARGVLS